MLKYRGIFSKALKLDFYEFSLWTSQECLQIQQSTSGPWLYFICVLKECQGNSLGHHLSDAHYFCLFGWAFSSDNSLLVWPSIPLNLPQCFAVLIFTNTFGFTALSSGCNDTDPGRWTNRVYVDFIMMGQLFVTEQRMCFRLSGTDLISYNEILFNKGNSFSEYAAKLILIFMIL